MEESEVNLINLQLLQVLFERGERLIEAVPFVERRNSRVPTGFDLCLQPYLSPQPRVMDSQSDTTLIVVVICAIETRKAGVQSVTDRLSRGGRVFLRGSTTPP